MRQSSRSYDECIYCQNTVREGTVNIIEGRSTYVILYPRFQGALDLIAASVVPYRHISNLTGLLLSPEEYAEHFRILGIVTRIVREALDAKSFIVETINSVRSAPLFHRHTSVQALSYPSQPPPQTGHCPLCHPASNEIIEQWSQTFSLRGGTAAEDADYGSHIILSPQKHVSHLEQCPDELFSRLSLCLQVMESMFSAPFLDIRIHEAEEAKSGHLHAHIHNRWSWQQPASTLKMDSSDEETALLDRVSRRLRQALG